jgi:hypothetical protein
MRKKQKGWRKSMDAECQKCSTATQRYCSRTGKCWKDHPETTGWANPDDMNDKDFEKEGEEL